MGGCSVNRFPDDWGPALGEDPDKPPAPPKGRRPKDPNSRMALVLHFNESIPVNMDRIGSNINGPAMISLFKKLEEKGFTATEIRGMINAFVVNITRRPLPTHVAPWRAFISEIDKYAEQIKRAPTTEENHEVEIDHRLL